MGAKRKRRMAPRRDERGFDGHFEASTFYTKVAAHRLLGVMFILQDAKTQRAEVRVVAVADEEEPPRERPTVPDGPRGGWRRTLRSPP